MCERFVRSIKKEALHQMLLLSEQSLYYTIQQYVTHYHYEPNHQDLGNRLIVPEPKLSHHRGPVGRRERLSGLLNYYHRAAA